MDQKTLLAQAKEHVFAGDLEKANQLKAQAQALREIEVLEASSATKSATVDRLPFSQETSSSTPQRTQQSINDEAIKSFYVGKYGEPLAGIQQISRELYGYDYEKAHHLKTTDFRRYLRTGHGELSHMALLQPEHLESIYLGDTSVGSVKATMVENISTLGGYSVPEEYHSEIIARLPGNTVVRSRANVMQTSTSRVLFPVATGGDSRYTSSVRVTWVEEVPPANKALTSLTWGQEGINVYTSQAEVALSLNLVQDAFFPLERWLTQRFVEAFAIDEDEKFLVGAGAGSPQGVLSGTAANQGPLNSGIATVNSGDASTLLVTAGSGAKGLMAVPDELAQQYRRRAVWTFNRYTGRVIRAMAGGTLDQFYWTNPAQGQFGPQQSTLLGYEVAESESMPNVAANTYPIIFADWSGYTIADRIGLTIERFYDSPTAGQNSVRYIARRRLGGQVMEPWKFAVQKVAA